MNPDSPLVPVFRARDEFLSEEDLDLQNLSPEELEAWWNLWLEAAQFTNDEDRFEYSHGVFRSFPFPDSQGSTPQSFTSVSADRGFLLRTSRR